MKHKTTIAIVIAASAVAVVALAAVVKHSVITSPKDSWFTVDSDGLRQLPAGLDVLRPTHLARDSSKIRHVPDGESLARTSGRNVTLRDLLAEAYDCDPGNIVLPPGAVQSQFDFVVTKPKPREHLREIIRKQLGYTAHHETRETAVLKLQVANASLPGFVVSPKSEDDDIEYTNGWLYFTHKPISVVVHGLEDGFGEPVVDETGMTNNYDYSMPWDSGVAHAMQTGAFSVGGVEKGLKSMGLELKTATENMDMVIVEKKP